MSKQFRHSWHWHFALIWLVILPLVAQAQCDFSPWISVWPEEKSGVIQPKQVFLFSGYDLGGIQSQAAALQKFGSTIRVYLWSAHDSVDLKVVDLLFSPDDAQYGKQAQLLLQPNRPLLASTEYELRASRGNENLFYLFKNSRPTPGQRRATAYLWKTSSAPDIMAPVWLTTPAVQQKKYEANSEGINNYVSFSIPLRDSSKYLVKATIRHVNNEESVTTYLFPWQNQLSIGWFTCGGNVRFKSEEEYTVRFEAIDAAGNRASASGQPIRFKAPKKVACCWGN